MIFLQKPGLVRDDSTSFQAVGAVLIFSLCHCHFCPSLCYRLSHYDRCSSFLVLLGLLADKLSVMEMGRKGSKRRPRAQRYERKNWMAVRVMVIDSFGLMIVWAGCFPLLSFSCSFFFPYFSSSLAGCQQDIGDGDEQWLTVIWKMYKKTLWIHVASLWDLCRCFYKKEKVQRADVHWSRK